ncbi:MAG: pitrilysin family protein, partial [Pseudomonadota bacterium]
STFLREELEMEKEVILQEIAGIDDVPDEIAYDLVLDAAFPGQSVGRPVIGTPDSVKAIGRSDLSAHLAQRYSSDAMVIAAAGAVDHEVFVGHVKAMFSGLQAGGSHIEDAARFVGGLRASKRGFEQCHLVVGFPGPSYRDDNFMLSQVFSGLLGGGMSSRLFQEVRENRGLCYSIYSSAWGLRDGGMFGIHAATGREMATELAEVVANELRKCASGDLTEKEVQRAKTQLKAGLLMSLESSSVRAEQMARQLLSVDRLISVEELITRIDDVTSDGLGQFAAGLLEFGQPAVAVVGAGGRSQRLAEETSRLFAA